MLRVFLIISLCFLTGCSTKQVVKVKYQEIYDFSKVKKYSLYKREHEFNEWQSISDALRNDIELAIENTLDKKGYQYTEVDSSDIVITYYLVGNSQKNFQRYNNGVNYCSYCLVYEPSGSRADLLDTTVGSLVIDAVDMKTKRSVWRSSYPLKIKAKDNSQEIQDKVHELVEVMLDELPSSKMPPVRN